mmetsp:Transcript_12880/g.34702  ORF Transcript_12880/g.34702 Transcript_12880/m.34702 type:complete len:251 (-) Transcript_12880:186-938(-)
MRSPRLFGCLLIGIPRSGTIVVFPGAITPGSETRNLRPSSDSTGICAPHNASASGMSTVRCRSLPRRVKRGCGFSAISNTTSPGVCPGRSSPASLNRILVPALYPGLTSTVSTFSICIVPPDIASMTCLVTFMFFLTPEKSSSSESLSSKTESWPFRGGPPPKDDDGIRGPPKEAPREAAPPRMLEANGSAPPNICSNKLMGSSNPPMPAVPNGDAPERNVVPPGTPPKPVRGGGAESIPDLTPSSPNLS